MGDRPLCLLPLPVWTVMPNLVGVLLVIGCDRIVHQQRSAQPNRDAPALRKTRASVCHSRHASRDA